MGCILGIALHFVTVLTCPHTAQITLPLCAEKTATICSSIWARSYKGGMFTLCCWERCISRWANAYTMFEAIFFRCTRIMLCTKSVDLFENCITLGIQIICAFHHFGDGLACREKRAFLLKHNTFAMFFPIF